ncbi:pyrroline-5-carboxylate reductase [Martelella alba]|uniref:Pyrroline-5-carboxylate reductase n=1 Tax=Martelella alba TaxID=2590451 RepID=A0ABY2SEB5_9HYPH|nr:pyrroline-5-carboxylate reductase [Martelella alba]TKI03085.1 pyrroline-5-carboxylate reductase [Martelella alba]
MQQRKIAFIGAGNMAQAIVAGLVANDYPAELITVCAPSAVHRDTLAARFSVRGGADNIAAARQADVIVMAVKPQLMADVCRPLCQDVDFSGKLVLSIAAGVSIERFRRMLGETLNVVRIMPNTPALVGKGMSGLYAPPGVGQDDRDFTADLMAAVGEICWVEKESDINGIIAAAGSAPAYFFLFMEAMRQEAVRMGFTPAAADTLVRQAAVGAAALAQASPDIPLGTLRENVTSKGGTTAAALQVFDERQLAQTVAEAMRAAVRRAEEMEKLF